MRAGAVARGPARPATVPRRRVGGWLRAGV